MRVGMFGQRSWGQGSLNIPGPGPPLKRSASRATSGSTSCRKTSLEGIGAPIAHRAVAVEELGDRLRVPGVPPPLAGGLAGRRDHWRVQNEQPRAELLGRERAGERAERLRDDDVEGRERDARSGGRLPPWLRGAR